MPTKKPPITKPIIILGQTPSAKNRHIMTFNRLSGKPLLLPNKKYAEWTKDALWQLKSTPKVKKYPVAMTCIFWVSDNRKRDLDNLCGAICDVLQKAGIIENDDWQHLRPITLDIGGINPENCRCEIWLDEA